MEGNNGKWEKEGSLRDWGWEVDKQALYIDERYIVIAIINIKIWILLSNVLET